ncbi:MAG: phosphatidylserine decarboxylase [Peptococcaceae bacterium]|nr:phosphatidylserine decarboxylase [Peptococcaceae bacterium]
MKESIVVNFLYRTILGRFFLKFLTQPCVSRQMTRFLDSKISAWMIPFFIKKHQIDMSQYPSTRYQSFNAFFTRKRCKIYFEEKQNNFLYSPCDGWLSIYRIEPSNIFKIKRAKYSVQQLLRDSNLADKYTNGFCYIFRLTPQHYHRYNYVCSGKTSATRQINGILHCVRPVAYGRRPVYTENSRSYEIIHSNVFGDIIQMEVGALMIGKICNFPHELYVNGGQEKGFFSFGGSTIILLVQKEKINIPNELTPAFYQEIPIRQDDIIGYIQPRG